MGIAGLWSWWMSAKGELVHSFAMLTINADEHELMNQFHKPTDEKRMVVILTEVAYQDWLEDPLNRVSKFLAPTLLTRWSRWLRRFFEFCVLWGS